MTSRRHLLALAVAVSTAVGLVVACGGKEGGDPKTASSSGGTSGDPASSSGGGGSSSSSGDPASSSSSGGGAGSSSSGSTTTNLPDSGELQGAKLAGEKSHKEVETKGDAGPKSTHGGSANEPGRTAADIKTRVANIRDEARACYDKALPSHPGIEGDLDIKWVITPEGAVTDASVDTTKSQILEPTVGQCIIDIIKKLKFPASKGGYETRAHYPFNFHPKQFSGKDAGK